MAVPMVSQAVGAEDYSLWKAETPNNFSDREIPWGLTLLWPTG
jgi:hypothetical protein